MILVTGGLGFVGSHTVRALSEAGAACVLVQRRAAQAPTTLAGEPVDVRVEQADIADLATLREIGTRHDITDIVHLAGPMPWTTGDEQPVDDVRTALDGLLNIVTVAQEWGVRRLGIASTIGVYHGVDAGPDGALREDMPLPMTSGHLIPAFKKVGELLGDHLAAATGLDIVNYRIGAIWGPLGHPVDPFFPVPHLVHSAARGTAPDPAQLANAHAEDAIDLCYVKDCGRAIALLQTAEHLEHRTYNVASGRATTNAEVVAAIRTVVPDFAVELPTGGPGRPNHLDITRARKDAGYEPAYDTERAVADYVAWLRAGHDR